MLDYGIFTLTYRLDKIERLLFELDYEVIDDTIQDFHKFLLITHLKSQKNVFLISFIGYF